MRLRWSRSVTRRRNRCSRWKPPEKGGEAEEEQREPVQIKKGDVAAALKDASLVKIEQTYITPTETHNPIEMSGTIAHWEGEQEADALRRNAVCERRAEHSGARVRSGAGECARHLPVCRRRVRLQRRGLAARPSRGDGRESRRRSGEIARDRAGTCLSAPAIARRRARRISLAATRDGKLQAMQHVSETLTSPVGRIHGIVRRAFDRLDV